MAAVDRHGLVRFSQATGRLDCFPLPDGLRHDLRLTVDGDEGGWLQTPQALASGIPVSARRVRFDPVTRRVVVAPRPAAIYEIQSDADGRLWVLRPEGIYRGTKPSG